MPLQSYQEVTSHLDKKKRTPHLLLGNGFSMAYDPDIFSYNALHGVIENADDELLTKLFGIVKTKNFELVMQQLGNFCELIEAFGTDVELLAKVRAASEKLKHTLIAAVQDLHPEHVYKIEDAECEKCAEFLHTYLVRDGNIFSTNYDILLYWVLLRSGLRNQIDGFGRDVLDTEFGDEPEVTELYWGPNKGKQNVHYLHGALPLFDTGIDVIKEEYTGDAYILENIEARMNNGEYPVFVAAGDGNEKLSHIVHNKYLAYCYEALSDIQGSLITFGFNFGEYDRHIIDAINAAAKQGRPSGEKLFSIYIGVYSDDDEKHINGIRGLFKCKVNLFDAKTASVWR
ncbi:MAG: DUF4917 family protein [Candidatus Sedimenticola sp. (ex Thyasira tokunagai)]